MKRFWAAVLQGNVGGAVALTLQHQYAAAWLWFAGAVVSFVCWSFTDWRDGDTT